MYFRIQVVTVTDDGTEHPQEIADLIRGEPKIDTMGLTLAESKQVLHDLQQTLVTHQVAAYLEHSGPVRTVRNGALSRIAKTFPSVRSSARCPCPIHGGITAIAKRRSSTLSVR